ncbi:MAG: hypothetical protein QNJ90_09100 [Planctomycetota bacterium]|nr:hypothetical protein [Planctomycetota bacterium]
MPRPSVRVALLALVVMGLLLPAGSPAALAKDERLKRGTPEPLALQKARRKAIRRGCDFLCGKPGSVPRTPGYEGKQRFDGGFGDNRAVVALTSLAVLALMADGSTDGRGRHGKAVARGIDFLLRLVENPKPSKRYPEGYFWYHKDSTSRMHGQGFATLALATALGTTNGKRARRIRKALVKAVACIERAQTSTGGFGYQPEPSTDHEGSVTVAVAQGLRAARDAGIVVNENVIRSGLHYLRKSQKKDGSFQYSLHQDQSSYALTAAALSSFFLYGRYTDGPTLTISRAIEYMRGKLERHTDVAWFYYGHFYAAWAAWQWDGHTWSPEGKNLWGWWHRRVYPDLLRKQRRTDGSFEPDSGRYDYGPVLSTAFAVLTLAIPDEVIPIFQR